IPEQAAINKNCSAGDVAGFIGSQKNRDGRHIFRLTEALQGNIFEQGFQFYRVVQQSLVNGCFNRAGRYGIYGNAQWRELNRKVAGQHFDATLAGAVSGEMRKGQLFMDRTNVDDFAASLGLHLMFHEGLADEEEAFEIYVQNKVIVGFRDLPEFSALLYAGVVDEHVDLAKLPSGFRHEA